MREQTFCVDTREDFARKLQPLKSAVAQSKESMTKTAGGMDIPPAVFWYLTILFVKTLCILSFDML